MSNPKPFFCSFPDDVIKNYVHYANPHDKDACATIINYLNKECQTKYQPNDCSSSKGKLYKYPNSCKKITDNLLKKPSCDQLAACGHDFATQIPDYHKLKIDDQLYQQCLLSLKQSNLTGSGSGTGKLLDGCDGKKVCHDIAYGSGGDGLPIWAIILIVVIALIFVGGVFYYFHKRSEKISAGNFNYMQY